MAEQAELDKAVTFVKRALTGVAAVIGFFILMSSWVNIPQGNVGVVFDKARGGVRPQTLSQGWHFRIPLVQWIQEYPVSLRTYSNIGMGEGSDLASGMLDLPTQEGQHIQQAISVVYNVAPASAAFVFDKFQGAEIEDIELTFIRRTVTSAATIIAGKRSVMDIYGPKKGEIQAEMEERLRKDLEPWGFVVDRVNLGMSKFPESIDNSLQQKVAAQQEAEAAKFKLLQAETDAKSRIAKAEGEAKANMLMQASLTPKLVSLRWIERWDGKLPTYMMGSAIPMVNVGGLSKGE